MNYVEVNFRAYDKHYPLVTFMGSALRGAFGYSLKRVVCVNPSFTCRDCFAKDSCLYYDFFEKANSYHNYRFDIKLDQKEFDFNFFLFDSACDRLPYIISAIHKMLKETGLGRDRRTFEKFTISVSGKTVFDENGFSMPKEFIRSFEVSQYHPNIKLEFITPFRTKKDNRLLKTSPSLELILTSIQNRANQLKNKKIKKLDFTPTYDAVSSHTYFKELTRLSNRQKTKMQFGGIMGEIEYKNIDKKSYELLKLGEIIGIGKQCVFGLGKIKVVDKK